MYIYCSNWYGLCDQIMSPYQASLAMTKVSNRNISSRDILKIFWQNVMHLNLFFSIRWIERIIKDKDKEWCNFSFSRRNNISKYEWFLFLCGCEICFYLRLDQVCIIAFFGTSCSSAAALDKATHCFFFLLDQWKLASVIRVRIAS